MIEYPAAPSGKQPPTPLHISALGNKKRQRALLGDCSNQLSPEIKLCSPSVPNFLLGASLLSARKGASI
jgi:hypothetical protein